MAKMKPYFVARWLGPWKLIEYTGGSGLKGWLRRCEHIDGGTSKVYGPLVSP